MRRFPGKRAHRKSIIIFGIIAFELPVKIIKGVKTVCRIKSLIILAMTALHFPVMAWGVRTNQLMSDSVLSQMPLKEGWFFLLRGKAIGKLSPVVCLHTLDFCGKGFDEMIHKHSGRVSAMLLKGFHKTPAGVFINRGVLIEFLTSSIIDQADRGNKLYIDLNTLSGVSHLLIGLRNILRIMRFQADKALSAQETVKASDRTRITTQAKFDPKDDKPIMGIAPAKIRNKFDLLRGMLVGMMMRSAGTVTQGLPGAVITPFPAINILTIGLVFDGSLRHTVLVSIVDEG